MGEMKRKIQNVNERIELASGNEDTTDSGHASTDIDWSAQFDCSWIEDVKDEAEGGSLNN